MEVMMNREQRRAARRAKPPRRGTGHIQMPVNMRFSAEEETWMMLAPTQGANTFLDGTADRDIWNSVMGRINFALILNDNHFNEGWNDLHAGRLVMREVREVGIDTGSWSMTNEQHGVVMTALNLANQMQKMCTRRELRDAMTDMMGQLEYNKRADAIKDKLDART
ncbi:hypothetical protein [Comamonas sp. JUb58]|uniref:hypothetical protein n=1 Tax=Comamonas sp. JUb58 TaxID=2485114 RepID=UPI00105F7B2B|nr:hypothetical protein [Comamonas sp. JUb58]TDS82583.1 hypothetical protein EDF71_107219 [Comamonas sp. JUb58]